MVGRFAYTVQKSKASKQLTALDMVGQLHNQAAVREGRLKNANSALLTELVDSYHSEQQAVLMSSSNLSAHLLETMTRDTAFWQELLRLSSADQHG